MTLALYLLGIASALLVLVVVTEMLRRGRLRERHTMWWLLAGFIGLIFSIFPDVVDFLAQLIGVEAPSNLLFFLAIVLLFLVCLQQSSELTRSEEKTRVLAEHVALIEDRIRGLETKSVANQIDPDADFTRE